MRRLVLALVACLALAGCGDSTTAEGAPPFELPVGPTEWDTQQPAWLLDGTLHVGDTTVELGSRVDEFVLGATGVYWLRGGVLRFTSAEGDTERVADVVWNDMVISADGSVFATVDQSRGPTDRYGAHVMQVAAFDTRTGEQLYRTPDEEPDDGADLGALYPELMPMLSGVSDSRIFFAGTTISLDDGSVEPAGRDEEGLELYEGYAETLFPDGFHVGISGQGRHRELGASEIYGVGRLSPDRSTIFDVGQWPTDAVVYDAESGRQRAIDAPWDHFTLVGWSDEDTFFGVAERIVPDAVRVLKEQQAVSCDLPSLHCTPVSPRVPTSTGLRTLMMEGGATFQL